MQNACADASRHLRRNLKCSQMKSKALEHLEQKEMAADFDKTAYKLALTIKSGSWKK